MKCFRDEIPTFDLIGNTTYIDPHIPFAVNPDVQLVCKYLKEYRVKGSFFSGIDKLFLNEHMSPIKYSAGKDLTDQLCQELLQENSPQIAAKSKLLMKTFVRLVYCYSFHITQDLNETIFFMELLELNG